MIIKWSLLINTFFNKYTFISYILIWVCFINFMCFLILYLFCIIFIIYLIKNYKLE